MREFKGKIKRKKALKNGEMNKLQGNKSKQGKPVTRRKNLQRKI